MHEILSLLAVLLLDDPGPHEMEDERGLRWRVSPTMIEIGTGPNWDPFLVGDTFEVVTEIVTRGLRPRRLPGRGKPGSPLIESGR